MTEQNLDVLRVGPEDQRGIVILPGARQGVARTLLAVQTAGVVRGPLVAELLARRDEQGGVMRDEAGRITIDPIALATFREELVDNPYASPEETQARDLYSKTSRELFPQLLREITPKVSEILENTPDFTKRMDIKFAELLGSDNPEGLSFIPQSDRAELMLDFMVYIARQQTTRIGDLQAPELRSLIRDAYVLIKILQPYSEKAIGYAHSAQDQQSEERNYMTLGRFITIIAQASDIEEAITDRAGVSGQDDTEEKETSDSTLASSKEESLIRRNIRSVGKLEQLAGVLRGTDAPIGDIRARAREVGKTAANLQELREHAFGLGTQNLSRGSRWVNANGDAMEAIQDAAADKS